jgi:CBS domain-containing protein
MKVKEIMSTNVITLKSTDTIKDSVKVLVHNNISGAPVVDQNGKVIGILSETDIIGALKTQTKELAMIFPSSHALGMTFEERITRREVQDAFRDVGNKPIMEVMSRNPITTTIDALVEDVAPIMIKSNINRVPVIENDKLVGIVTRRDIINGLIKIKSVTKD